MEMTKYKLGDIAKTGSGGTPKSTVADYYENGNIPWINSGELNNPFISSTSNFITQKGYDNSSAKLFPSQTVLLAMYGATAGKASLLEFEACTNQAICAIMPNQDILLPRFLKYKLDTMYNYLVGLSTGSARDNLSQDGIKALELCIPPLSEQKKIASVLSALDDKIALNKKMNQKLEAMAKRLYDYWFVQYDFPDKNGHPYKTTGGPMTYNPTLKREIPAGWEVSNICPLMEILPGGTPSKAKPEYWNGEIPFFGPTDYCGDVFQLSTEEHITENGLNNCASALYPPKTIFITARGSVGKLIVCGKPMAMNQSCYALKPFDLEKYEYLFYLTKQLIEQLKKKGSGSVFKSINTLDIEQSFLSIAPNEIIDLYCKKVKSIFERIKSNTVEIAKLTALRDKLLPLLMNGQVTIK